MRNKKVSFLKEENRLNANLQHLNDSRAILNQNINNMSVYVDKDTETNHFKQNMNNIELKVDHNGKLIFKAINKANEKSDKVSHLRNTNSRSNFLINNKLSTINKSDLNKSNNIVLSSNIKQLSEHQQYLFSNQSLEVNFLNQTKESKNIEDNIDYRANNKNKFSASQLNQNTGTVSHRNIFNKSLEEDNSITNIIQVNKNFFMFASNKEEIINKWVCLINYFINE